MLTLTAMKIGGIEGFYFCFYLRLVIVYEYIAGNIPTTSMSAKPTTVVKLGASADTSHVYLPVIFGVKFSSITCDPLDCVSYEKKI